MNAIEAARELGKAIQADERYRAYLEAKEANDRDEQLQVLIHDFNRKRGLMQVEMQKPESEKDAGQLQKLNKEMQDSYGNVMKNANMANFVVVKTAFDQLLEDVNTIIALCCEGDDPETCDPRESGGCSGSCSTCGGCG
ncbi:MAG: YlbF family regulator [Bacteroides sp.]|nr:YlbF family regulator [Eubacterium sp.]MCM1417345.1 YlbF family regulator [Roseburia sp.]MCM1461462.1 YlbF family regulator [Bacteroides sp.]